MEKKEKKRKNDDEDIQENDAQNEENIKTPEKSQTKSKKKNKSNSKSKNKSKSKSKNKSKSKKKENKSTSKNKSKNKKEDSEKENENSEKEVKEEKEEKEEKEIEIEKENEKEKEKEKKSSAKKAVSPSKSLLKSKPKNKQSKLESFGIKSLKESETDVNLPPCPKEGKLKFIHWNINGIRPLLKTNELNNLIESESPDFLCFNETKIDSSLISTLNLSTLQSPVYKSYWHCSDEKKGYAGTGILTKYKPINCIYGIDNETIDNEGRVITLEYENFYLIVCYTPNAGEGLKRLDFRIDEWDKKFFEYVNQLKSKKDIILCGDLNVANNEIDIFEPKGHEKSAGFTLKERDSFKSFLKEGYVDTFREKYPEEKKYSFFSKRSKAKLDNRGWRLDYFIINENNKNFKVLDSDMLDKEKYNSSDHIPIKLEIELI